MSAARITINGEVVLDDDLGEWKHTPPEALKALATPTPKPIPGIQAVLLALTQAALADQPIRIDLQSSPDGWCLTVVTP